MREGVIIVSLETRKEMRDAVRKIVGMDDTR